MPNRSIHSEGEYAHFVTFSCYKRRKLLSMDECKRMVIEILESQLARQKGICVGFVIMLDHVHGLVWFPQEYKISQLMNKWKELSSKRIASLFKHQFPKYWSKLGPNEPVWQPRYYDFNIYSNKKLQEKLDYMHNNPVRAGLVKDICDWPWSSARWYKHNQSVGIPISWPPQGSL